MRRTALILTVMWFTIGGIAHFVATDALVGIVPAYVPVPRVVVYVSGALELLGAMGMCLPKWRRSAAWCLILLTILVTPANVAMLLHAVQYPQIPRWALIARLPLQVLLLLAIIRAGGLVGRAAHRSDSGDCQSLTCSCSDCCACARSKVCPPPSSRRLG